MWYLQIWSKKFNRWEDAYIFSLQEQNKQQAILYQQVDEYKHGIVCRLICK